MKEVDTVAYYLYVPHGRRIKGKQEDVALPWAQAALTFREIVAQFAAKWALTKFLL